MDKDHQQHDERANQQAATQDDEQADTQANDAQRERKRAYDEGYRDGSRRVIKAVRAVLSDTNNDNEGALLQIGAILDKIDVH